jgi:hypothetical protein
MHQNWTDQHAKQLKNKKEELENLPRFEYPFDEKLKRYLDELDQETIPIFSYGSLLNYESAQRSVSEQTLETMEPAVGFGLKRVFNRDVDISGSNKYNQDHPKERGMLNVDYTESFSDLINGVIMNITKEEIENICIREEGYDLVPIFNIHWDILTDEKIQNYQEAHISTSYTFYAPPEKRQGEIPVDESIFPIKQYYKLVKDGAKRYGDEFLDLWVDTTFLADKETNVKEWEEKLN